jgi:UDPglucose 6-dehydrogenase
MKVCMIGTGYVGLVSGTCFAEIGHSVCCVDIDENKINALKNSKIPIYEPGLEELVKRNVESKRLKFSTSLKDGVESAEVVFIAVGTPPNEDGTADLQHVLGVARSIGEFMNGPKIVVNKSTVPVGTGARVESVIKEALAGRKLNYEFDVVSNPEFLKEGDAIADFMRPDRVVVGVQSEKGAEAMRTLYAPFVANGHPIIVMDRLSSELTKYAANAMLATRISFMNEISQLCEKTGADIQMIRKGIGSDARIGMPFLYAGLGYGGSCFPKDVKALQATMKEAGVPTQILDAVEKVNKAQRKKFADKIFGVMGQSLSGKTVAVWGLSFKPRTDDMREAPSIDLISALVANGAKVVAHDPEAMENASKLLPKDNVAYVDDMYQATQQADALLLLTEWAAFRSPDFEVLKKNLKKPLIFDGRNQFEPSKMRTMGFEYHCVGRR